jgi:hypothetical protein
MARIGDPDYYVIPPNYPIPFSTSRYEVGQYAPSDSSISALRLAEAHSLGLFLDPTVDIYDEEGNVSEKKVKRYNKSTLLDFAIPVVDENAPYYALFNIRAVMKQFPENLYKILKIKSLNWILRYQTAKIDQQNYDLYVISHKMEGTFFEINIFQPYYIYITVPVVRMVPNVTPGISVASVATAETIAEISFSRILKVFPEYISEFLKVRGWTKEIPENQSTYRYIKSGELYNIKTSNAWYHYDDNERFSINTVLSPKDDFVESFVFFYFHREFLEQYPKLYSFFDKLDKFIKKI